MCEENVDEDDLLRLAADCAHFSKEHHQKDNDAYYICLNIKPCVIHIHNKIIDLYKELSIV